MRKKLRFYRQHTMETCGISCILMLLDYYERIQYPTVKMEHKLYGRYRSWAYAGVTGGAAARCLDWNGLSVTVLHSSQRLMENRESYFEEDLYDAIREEYRSHLAACSSGVTVKTGVEISCQTLRRALSQGRQILLQCFVPGDADGIHDHVLHWILVYGWEGKDFLVCDPLSSKLRLTEQALEGYMDTPIGRLCILVEEKMEQ